MNASKPILIAYDGSSGAKAAIEAAARLFPKHPAVVVSVWHSASAASAASLIAIPAGVATSAYQELDKESERQAMARASSWSAVKSALLGSVANGVVHHSTRPVVVIPSRA